MLNWLFGKRIARAEALEHYLSHFNAGELAYLKNITIMGLMPNDVIPGAMRRSDIFLLAAYIHAEWMVATGEIKAAPIERGQARATYNMRLAKDMSKLRGAGASEFFSLISSHELKQPELDADQEDRLGAHAIVLERIFVHPERAATLPELNAIGEGTAWLTPNRTQPL